VRAVLPPAQMAKLMQSIDEMPNSDPKKVVLKRIIAAIRRRRAWTRPAGFVCPTKWPWGDHQK